MSTSPRDFAQPAPRGPLPGGGAGPSGASAASALNIRWLSLHDAAAPVARLAGLVPPPLTAPERQFPSTMRELGGWRRALAEQAIDDLAAVLQSGIAALLAVHGKGANPQPAAPALWAEFIAARTALLALAGAGAAAGARRLG
jgi:hypothetical protein